MTQSDWSEFGLFMGLDGYNQSAPWKLRDYGMQGALSDAQKASLSGRFGFTAAELENLSLDLAVALDSKQGQILFPIGRSLAAKRGAKVIESTAKTLSSVEKRLKQTAEEVSRVWADEFRHAGEHTALVRARDSVRQAHAAVEAAIEALALLTHRPTAALLLAPKNAKHVPDLRRRSVIALILRFLCETRRDFGFTTDTVTSERQGPLIDFVNAVVECVSDPPSKLSPHTIVAEITAARRRRDEADDGTSISAAY